MAQGLNLGLGSGGAGAYEGVRQWIADRLAQQQVERQNALVDRRVAMEDRELALQEQGALASQRAMSEAFAAIDADPNLNPMQKLAAKLRIRSGQALPEGFGKPEARKVSRVGGLASEAGKKVTRGIDEATGETVYELPEFMEEPKPQPQTISTDKGTEVIDLRQSIGKTFPAPPKEPRASGDGGPLVAVQTVDEQGNPVTRYLTRDEARGQTFRKPSAGAGAVLPAAMREKLVDANVSRQLLTQLKAEFDKGGKDVIGPLEGRARSLGEKIPGIPVNESFSKFAAATNRLRNATIKAITGAAMSDSEAARIMAELPTENDKPEVWQIRYEQSLKNLDYLEDAIRRQGGGQPSSSTSPPPTASQPTHRYVPGTGLVPIGGQP